MKFLFMVCEEYHDVYSNHHCVEAKSFDEVFGKYGDDDYGMRGYMCAQAVEGPVHPQMYTRRGKTVLRPAHHPDTKFIKPTLGDLLRKQMAA